MNHPHKALSVLIIAPDTRVQGGVMVFAETLKANLRNCRVSSFAVGSVPGERLPARVWRVLFAPFAVVYKVKAERVDVVHINPSFTAQSLIRDGLIILLLRLCGFTRVLVYFHGWDTKIEPRLRRSKRLCVFLAWILNGTSRVLVLAPEFLETLTRMGVRRERITLARTLFDGNALNAPDTQPSARRFILYLSRFEREKGIYELVEAFARIKDRFPDVDLIMAGGGGLECAELKACVADLGLNERVTFPGYVQGEDKALLLKNCALFALPTWFGEGMPIALLEAMGAGKPVLTAKAGAIASIVRDPENGVVLETVSAESVAEGLARLLSDPAFCEEIGRRNKRYAWDRFEAKGVVREIKNMYQEVAHARG